MRLSDHPDINWNLQPPASSYGKGSRFDTSTVLDDAIVMEAEPAPKSPLEVQLIKLKVKQNDRETTCQISVKTKSLEWFLQILKSNTGRTIREIKRLEVPEKGNS